MWEVAPDQAAGWSLPDSRAASPIPAPRRSAAGPSRPRAPGPAGGPAGGPARAGPAWEEQFRRPAPASVTFAPEPGIPAPGGKAGQETAAAAASPERGKRP